MKVKKYVAFESENLDGVYYDFLIEDIENDSTLKNGVFIGMNKDFKDINFDLIKLLNNSVISYSDYDLSVYYKNNLANLIIDAIKPYKKISLKQALDIQKIVNQYNNERKYDRYDTISMILGVIYLSVFNYAIMRGCVQSDWIYCFYNTQTITNEKLSYIESVIFNTGLEIIVSSTPIEIDTKSDIDDIKDMVLCECNFDNIYTQIWDIDDRKKYIASLLNCNIDDVIYYAIDDSKVITYTKYFYKQY